MAPLAVLIAIAALLIIAAVVWRVNSMLLFTSVAVGDLLVRHLGEDAVILVESFVKGANTAVVAKLGLLFLPVLLTLLFGRHSLSKAKAVLHFVPIIATGGVLALLTLPLLSSSFQATVYNSPIGTNIRNVQDVAIAGAGVASLVVAWLTNPKHRDKKH